MTNPNPASLNEVWDLASNPSLLKLWIKDTDRNVKEDIADKLTTILTFLSAHVRPLEPLNNAKKSASGTGKSWVTTKIAGYFPRDCVEMLAGASPTSFVHQVGVLMDAEGKNILPEEEPKEPKRRFYPKGKDGETQFQQALEEYHSKLKSWNKRLEGSYELVDIGDKTLVFLELPPEETVRMLLPILSHDTTEYKYKITEKVGDRHRTISAVLKGSPAAILLSVAAKYMYELTTRCVTEGPEDTPTKISEANKLTNEKAAFNMVKEDLTRENEIKTLLQQIINSFRYGDLEVTVPVIGLEKLFPKNSARTMRQFKFLFVFIRAITALHMFQRPIIKVADRNYVISSVEDVLLAYKLYSTIWETSASGREESVIKFYYDIVINHRSGNTISRFTEDYNIKHPDEKITTNKVYYLMKALMTSNYISRVRHPTDRREWIYIPLVKEGEKNVGIVSNLQTKQSLRQELEKCFESWLRNDVWKVDSEQKKTFHFTKENDNVKLTEIDGEEFRRIVTIQTRDDFSSVSLQELFPSSGILPPQTSISSNEPNLKSEIKAEEGLKSEIETSQTICCALCDQPIEGEDDEGIDFSYEALNPGETRSRWMDQHKNVRVHTTCSSDLHSQGFYNEQIAERIEENEKKRGKTYNTPSNPVEDSESPIEMFRRAVKSGTKRESKPS